MANRINRFLNDITDLGCELTVGTKHLGEAYSYGTEGLAVSSKAWRDKKVRNAAAVAEVATIEDALVMDERIYSAQQRRLSFDAKKQESEAS
jgi:hypothetical protein